MRRIAIMILLLSVTLSMGAQTQKRFTTKKAKTTQTTDRRKKTSSKKALSTTAKGSTTRNRARGKVVKTTKNANNTIYTNSSIRGLQSQRAAIQKKIREQEQALRHNQADVKQRLQNLLVINSEIEDRQKSIDGIQSDIHHIEGNIGILKSQLKTLEQQLNDRKAKYIKSMRYMARHRTVQDRLMFIFSAKSLTQMYRRLRFVREYAAFQRAQGEQVMAKQNQVNNKHRQLETVKGHKNTLLYKNQKAHAELQNKQNEQQQVVQGLQKQQKTIQGILAQQRQKDAALNAQIDRLVAQEVAKARARAAAEAQRKAAAAAAAKKRAAELAAKKAAAEAAARENARRVAEAKAAEEKAKAQAEAARQAALAAQKAQQEQAAADAKKKEQQRAAEAAAAARAAQVRAEQQAREAEAARQAAELKAKADAERNERAVAEAKKDVEEAKTVSTVDRMMSGGFEANKGRLPMPITGSYRIVSHFGQYNVEGLKGVTLDNKGINILGQAGCMARSIYDGEVSAVFGYAGSWNVMVRHGVYISVYCNLKSVSVRQGQRVSARQALGTVGPDHILQFQLRKETAKLNPESWLGR